MKYTESIPQYRRAVTEVKQPQNKTCILYLGMGGGPLGEAVLCCLMFGNLMGLFKLPQDVINLLAYHLPAILLILGRCF